MGTSAHQSDVTERHSSFSAAAVDPAAAAAAASSFVGCHKSHNQPSLFLSLFIGFLSFLFIIVLFFSFSFSLIQFFFSPALAGAGGGRRGEEERRLENCCWIGLIQSVVSEDPRGSRKIPEDPGDFWMPSVSSLAEESSVRWLPCSHTGFLDEKESWNWMLILRRLASRLGRRLEADLLVSFGEQVIRRCCVCVFFSSVRVNFRLFLLLSLTVWML